MTASERLVRAGEKADLAAMLQDYIGEMVQFAPEARAGQAYPYFDLYWGEPDARWPYWICVDDRAAGFALLRRDAAGMQMAEFFVARPYRRRGIGVAAARRLIARFPGQWSITQREDNAPAIAFWQRVLDGFVAYEETTTRTNAVRREQRFNFAQRQAAQSHRL
jgi:predicted acetyltransferase